MSKPNPHDVMDVRIPELHIEWQIEDMQDKEEDIIALLIACGAD